MENRSTVFVGMDVHKETIHVAAVDAGGAMVERWELPNGEPHLGRLVKRLRGFGEVRCVYEAGPCGYHLRRYLEAHKLQCMVAAPSLIARKPGDRIKTDRRDAENLARRHRMGDLTAVSMPSPQQEALRDLVRSLEDAKQDLLRHRHRVGKFLLRQGRRHSGRSWTKAHWAWMRAQRFEDQNADAVYREYHLALEQQLERVQRLTDLVQAQAGNPVVAGLVGKLRALRGVDTVTAMTLATELVDLRRFTKPTQLMKFIGMVPSEHSSGSSTHRGSITRAGNAHVRRVLVEAGWHYRHSPRGSGVAISRRREGQPTEVIDVARKAEMRLHAKYQRLVLGKGKRPTVAVVAVARELAGFVWAITRV
jgi:transposase